MTRSRLLYCIAFAAFPLAACDGPKGPATPEPGATFNASPGAVVNREEVKPAEPPVTPMAPVTVIQSQPGPDGSQVDLLKVAVTGDVLTVTLRCTGPEKYNSKSMALDKISVIDDATAQRIGVLKDNDGKWLASNVSGNYLGTACEAKPSIFWAKFPAPPATSKTVSINFPEIAPFDGVPVTR